MEHLVKNLETSRPELQNIPLAKWASRTRVPAIEQKIIEEVTKLSIEKSGLNVADMLLLFYCDDVIVN